MAKLLSTYQACYMVPYGSQFVYVCDEIFFTITKNLRGYTVKYVFDITQL